MANRYRLQGVGLASIHCTDRLERDLQQLRIEPGLRLLPAREQNLHLLAARVDRVVALILVVAQRREIPDAIGELPELFRQFERIEQAIRTARRACLCSAA